MKKILALLMAVALLATLTACGGNTEPNTDTSTTTTTSVNTTTTTDAEESTTTTEATDEGTTTSTEGTETTANPTEDKIPTTTAKPTEGKAPTAAHTHKYTSKVTKAATCAAEGVKTFTCSCGDTYTEKVAATAHKWGEWKQTTAPSYTAKGKETRTCSGCSKKETRDVAQLSLDEKFKEYIELMREKGSDLGNFDSTDALTPEKIVIWIDMRTPVESLYDNRWVDIEIGGEMKNMLARDYSVKDIDAFTTSVFGRTYDFTKMNLQYYDGSHWFQYDAKDKMVTIFMYGGAGSGPADEIKYNGYTKLDGNHYEVTYTQYGYYLDRETMTFHETKAIVTMIVEMKNGNPIIISHKKGEVTFIN